MNFAKRLLYRILSPKNYLKLLHIVFYWMYDLNLLKGKQAFKYHYVIKKVIQPDFVVVDIGANLGYFSKNFARLTPHGKVISIEPIPLFYEVLTGFLSKFSHVKTYNVALGMEEGKTVMVLPSDNGMIRTGLPHIAKNDAELQKYDNQEVAIVRGSELLKDLTKLDYIKCDIEGFEGVVFKEIEPIIQKFKPFIQLEISIENREEILNLFSRNSYQQYGIANYQFIKEVGNQREEGDYFFVPNERESEFLTWI
ncbi:MAG: FkbM family methyltransferase [Bacteroidetes bacterium]|nr:FkbM family methyltransferase [Bacteroidota bacterium]